MEVYKILLYLPVHKNIMLEGFFSKINIHITQNITNFLSILIKGISCPITFLSLHLVTKQLFVMICNSWRNSEKYTSSTVNFVLKYYKLYKKGSTN